jgi:hypothetical protein
VSGVFHTTGRGRSAPPARSWRSCSDRDVYLRPVHRLKPRYHRELGRDRPNGTLTVPRARRPGPPTLQYLLQKSVELSIL